MENGDRSLANKDDTELTSSTGFDSESFIFKDCP